MTIDLFAGLAASDYQRALTWYEQLLGSGPAFFPNATEAVWELAGHRYLYIKELPERTGHALHTGVPTTSMSGSRASAREESSPPRRRRTGTVCAR